MSEKLKLVLSALGLAAFFTAAYLGYNYLESRYKPNTIPIGTPAAEDNNVNSDNTAKNSDDENNNSGENTEAENEQSVTAPDFKVYDADGTAVEFSKLVGRPTIINFWATWCNPCKAEMPHFQKAYEEYSDAIEFMMINPTDGINDTKESVEGFLSQTGYTFPVYYDFDSSATSVYGISSFPLTFFIDANGNVLGYYPGSMSEEILYQCIDILLSDGKNEG